MLERPHDNSRLDTNCTVPKKEVYSRWAIALNATFPVRGSSSADRAPRSQRGGRRFESGLLHQFSFRGGKRTALRSLGGGGHRPCQSCSVWTTSVLAFVLHVAGTKWLRHLVETGKCGPATSLRRGFGSAQQAPALHTMQWSAASSVGRDPTASTRLSTAPESSKRENSKGAGFQ